ncbi:hypothetical protein [Dyella monticola]|uniref:hypothetical protein n=1 Tax=Dyella monticola TaxID=1927958 RepID=UPI001E314B80|nr:hypothetical protein [Dyella monticola]
MLRKLMVSGPLLSRGLCDAIAAMMALLYLAIYANARALLPDFIFRDADKIQTQIGGGSAYSGTSFDVAGRFYAALGTTGTNAFVATLGVLFIWATLRQTRHAGALFANLALIVPCLFFNLFVASKDTLVVLMTLVLWLVARRYGTVRTFVVAVALYLGYAAMIRSYFILIAISACCAWWFRRATLPRRIIASLLLMVALALLPDTVYYALQHPRDAAVDYLMYGSPFGARTSFHNPFAPDSLLHFVGNYLYSVPRLNLPVLFSPDTKGIAMQCFIALMLAPAWAPLPRASIPMSALPGREVLACIVLGQVAISMLFEPDLGSYTRHLSSLSLFAAALWAQRVVRTHPPGAAVDERDARASRSARSMTSKAGLAVRSARRRP